MQVLFIYIYLLNNLKKLKEYGWILEYANKGWI